MNRELNLHLTPEPTWRPGPAELEHANAARLCRRLGLPTDFAALHRWSVENREAYWKVAAEELGLRFATAPTTYLRWDDAKAESTYLDAATLNIVESCLQGAPSALAVVEENGGGTGRSLTYAELRSRCERVAAGYVAMGIGSGDAVAIDMPMSIEAVLAYLGALWIGASVVSIADSFAPDEIATRLRLGQAKLVVTQDTIARAGKRLPMFEKVAAATPLPCVVVETGGGPALRAQDRTFQDFLARGGSARPELAIRPAMATINVLFSSGTTGDPKAIPWNQATPLKCAADARYHHDVREGDVVCWPTNLGWMMGPWLVFAALLNRAAIALYTGSPNDRAFATFVARRGVTMLGVVPSLVKTWRQAALFEGVELPSLRAFSSTGECSNPGDMIWLMGVANNRAPVIEYCGGTEIGGGYVTSSVLQPNVASAFTTPALGLDFQILDEEGQPTDDGEVWISPPSIGLSTALLNRDHFASYFEGTPRDASGHRLRRHGDQVVRLPGGYYQALGRVDDTMNLGGIKTSSAEIERAMVASGLIAECAAIAVPPPGGGPSLLVLYVVIGTDSSAPNVRLHESLQQVMRERLNPLFKIQDLRVVEKLPRTASNKVMRRVLRDEYLKSRG